MTGELRLTVRAVTRAAEDVVLIDLERPGGGALPRWAPGAHVDVVLPGGRGERQYSLCGDPAETDVWRIGVLREEGGRGGSVWRHDRFVGGPVSVRGPANPFAFEPFPGRQY